MISASCAASSASWGVAHSDPAKRCTCGCEPEITAASDATSPSCAALITFSVGQDVRAIYLKSMDRPQRIHHPGKICECVTSVDGPLLIAAAVGRPADHPVAVREMPTGHRPVTIDHHAGG